MTTPKWESKRTDESRLVERELLNAGFQRVDSYRYNSASLRLRIIDSRFENVDRDERDSLVEPHIDRLPESIQADIVTLVLLSPSELQKPADSLREFILNTEFDDPSPSML